MGSPLKVAGDFIHTCAVSGLLLVLSKQNYCRKLRINKNIKPWNNQSNPKYSHVRGNRKTRDFSHGKRVGVGEESVKQMRWNVADMKWLYFADSCWTIIMSCDHPHSLLLLWHSTQMDKRPTLTDRANCSLSSLKQWQHVHAHGDLHVI